MSIKKTVILFIILVLMGGYYYTRVNLSEKQQAQEEAAKKVFTATEEALQEISIKRQNEEIVLKKQEETWKMLQPVEAFTDAEAVKQLVTDFVKAEQQKTVAEDKSQDQEFGLDQPQLVVIAKGQAGTSPMQLALGNETPTTSGFYARVDNQEKVVIVGSPVKTGLDKSMYDLRDKTILAFAPDQVKKAILTLPSEAHPSVELEQKDAKWQIVTPQNYQADTAKMNAMLSKITSSSIKAFTAEKADNLAQYSLDQPNATLSLFVGEDKSQKTLFLGKKNESGDGVYAKHEGAQNVFLVDAAILDEFPKSVNDLRDKTLFAFKSPDIQKIELASQGETIVLERASEEEWQITQPESFKADSAKVQQLLSNAESATVQQFVSDTPEDLAQYGLAAQPFTIRLWQKDQETPHELLLGSPDQANTGIYAKLGSQNAVVLVKADTLAQLHQSAFDLRYKKILAFDRAQVEQIQLTYADQKLVLEKDGDDWKATEPEQKTVAFFKVNNLLYDLNELEFTQKLDAPDANLSKYGLAEPEVRITLRASDKELLALLIGKAVQGQEHRYVKLAADATVYAIAPQFLQELPKNLADLAE